MPGFAKTRLARDIGAEAAAGIAAAALLDTLEVVREAGGPSVVALTGHVAGSVREREIELALAAHIVVAQRGRGLGERLANAHVDAASTAGTAGVVQIGMDTPQLSVALLRAAVATLDHADAALGPATDGGWWCLAVREASLAGCLIHVAMSRPDTGQETYDSLLRAGARTVSWLPELRDVDTLPDALEVARVAPGSRLAAAVEAHVGRPVETSQ